MNTASLFPWLGTRQRRAKAIRPHKKPVIAIERQPGGTRLLLLAIGFLALAVAPHLPNIRLEVIGLFVFFAGWRVASAFWRWLPRNRWIILLFAVVGFTISAWMYGPPLGRDPGVAFLIVMAGLKSVELTVIRDVRIIILLSLFIIITHFLYATGVNWVIPLAVLVIALTWLMAQVERAEPERFPLADLRMVGKLMLQALPFVIILFYLFPRLSGSLFLLQSESNSAVTGLSDSLTMGTVSNLIQSDDIAFTATFPDGNVPPHEERYWRGGVLWRTDGREWVRGPAGAYVGTPAELVADSTPVYEYEIELEPTNQRWLYTLDYPTDAPDRSILFEDYQLVLPTEIEQTYRYSLSANTDRETQPLSEYAKWQSLQLGGTVITPRLQTLIDGFTTGAESDGEVVNRALRHFREQPFSYTLQPPLLSSEAPVDEFMFESRRGFCGHYASSFATMMRQAGIPTRMVVGYLGGELNPRSDQIVVKQSAAHAWTEVWLDDRWNRIDPTAAVAPERIEFPIDYDGSTNGDGSVLFDSGDFSGFGRILIELTWYKDLIKAKWNRWFVAFDSDRQKQLLQRLGLDRFNLQTLSSLAFLLALGILTIVSLALLRRESRVNDPVQRIYTRFANKARKQGMPRMAHEGPRDFAHRLTQRFPHAEREIQGIADLYIRLRYADLAVDSNESGKALGQFRQLVNRLSLR